LASSSIQTVADMVKTMANTQRLRVNHGAPGSPCAIAATAPAPTASRPRRPARWPAATGRRPAAGRTAARSAGWPAGRGPASTRAARPCRPPLDRFDRERTALGDCPQYGPARPRRATLAAIGPLAELLAARGLAAGPLGEHGLAQAATRSTRSSSWVRRRGAR
jgi:hypothetical protein